MLNATAEVETAREGSGPGPVRRHPRALLTLAILLTLTILSYLDRMAIVLLVDPIKRSLAITDVQISLLQGLAFALCFAVSSIPMGWLADRYSRRWVIFGGVMVWSMATAGAGIASNFGEMFVARFFVGVGEAALAPAAYTLLADLFPRRQLGTATGILSAGAAIGSGLAILSGAFLVSWAEQAGEIRLPIIGVTEPWQFVFLALGLPGVLAAFLIFIAPEKGRTTAGPPASGAATGATGFADWLRRNFAYVAGLSAGTSMMGIMAYGLTNWTPAFLSRTLGVDMQAIGLTLGIVQMVVGICGYVFGGVVISWLTARNVTNVGYRYMMTTSAVSAAAGVAGFAFSDSLGFTMACLAVFHLAMPFTTPMVATIHAGTPPGYAGRIIAIVMTVSVLCGMAMGPSAVAMMTDYVFRDPARVGQSIAAVCAVAGPLAILCFAFTFRAFSRASAELMAQPG